MWRWILLGGEKKLLKNLEISKNFIGKIYFLFIFNIKNDEIYIIFFWDTL